VPRSNVTVEAARFGAIIRRLRLARGWTAVYVAKSVGMNSRYLGVLEQGGNDTSLSMIVKICRVLDADIGEVMREVASGPKN
jgi:transcriptional regulator with XRE-family HTH domain